MLASRVVVFISGSPNTILLNDSSGALFIVGIPLSMNLSWSAYSYESSTVVLSLSATVTVGFMPNLVPS